MPRKIGLSLSFQSLYEESHFFWRMRQASMRISQTEKTREFIFENSPDFRRER